MKYTEEDYLNEPWFEGDESEVTLQTKKFVKVRKEHPCLLATWRHLPQHNVQKGSYAYYEKALVDGEFCSFYMCTDCMDAFLDEAYEGCFEKDDDW